MSRGSNVGLGVGVFVVAFTVAWIVMPHVGDFTGLPPPAPAKEPAAIVLPTFADTRKSLGPGRRMSDKELADEQARSEREVLRVVAKFKGRDISPELIRNAQDDAPKTASYVRYATIEKAKGVRVACTSVRVDGQTEHMVSSYTATDIDAAGSTTLPEYVLSGCAEAIRDNSRLLTHTQYLQILMGSLPKTRAYDQERLRLAEAMREISQRPPGYASSR